MIFIQGNVPSSKNGRIFAKGRSLPSASCAKYYKASKKYWEDKANKAAFLKMVGVKEFPIKVEFHFIRDSRRRFDYINPAQTIQDLMVKHGWLDDDNADYIIPVFKPYGYDKLQSGVYITVL
jgi:hypothetical protein